MALPVLSTAEQATSVLNAPSKNDVANSDASNLRKIDNVQLTGIGYGVVSRSELFAIVYMAPQLAFFARHVAKVEQIGRSARIREGPAVAKAP